MKPLKTIDAETLLATPLEPVRFVVDRLIPPGLNILGGYPKFGKSWLMLWLCLKVANGEPLWEFETQKCTALYLCLEDTFYRVQNRLFQITDEAPENLHFSIIAEQIGSGLQEQIKQFIDQHPNTRLIVIDTLQRVRGASMDNNAYANDYRDLSILKGLADSYNISIITVHHLRKLDDDDPFLCFSGTTGLTGAVDSAYVLKKTKDGSVKLFAKGRDIEYQAITVKFENCIWQFVSCENVSELEEKEVPTFLFRLVNFMKDKAKWQGGATELLVEMKDDIISANAITKLLNQYHGTFLIENGIVYKYTRTGKARIITLTSDSNDGYDSDLPAEKESS